MWDAVVLAGGRGSRLGGVDKATIEIDEERLVDRVVSAARAAGAARVIVAGPSHTGTHADAVVREEPPFSGPLAALDAALVEVDAAQVMLLACDLVRPQEVVRQLVITMSALEVAAGGPGDDGTVLIDAAGRKQWLAGSYRTEPLRAALAATAAAASAGSRVRSFEDLPLRAALGRLALSEHRARTGSTDDIDTPEHLARARATAHERTETRR